MKTSNWVSCLGLFVYYRPQRSWGRVMFFTLVCDSVHREGSASVHAGMPTPLARRPPSQGRPPGKETPPARKPPAQCMLGRYGQQAGGMNPTGMQFLLFNWSPQWQIQDFPKGVAQTYNVANLWTVCKFRIWKDGVCVPTIPLGSATEHSYRLFSTFWNQRAVINLTYIAVDNMRKDKGGKRWNHC